MVTNQTPTLPMRTLLPSPARLALGFLLLAPVAHADLVAHYRLEEGAVDLTTNTTYCSVSDTNYGTLDANSGGTLEWITTGLPNVPAPGTAAALRFVSLANGSYNHPHVAMTMVTEDQTGNRLAGSGPKSVTA